MAMVFVLCPRCEFGGDKYRDRVVNLSYFGALDMISEEEITGIYLVGNVEEVEAVRADHPGEETLVLTAYGFVLLE